MTESNTDISLADWVKDQLELSKIRRQVFIEEQHVPEELEWDEHDNTSTHFIVTIDDKVVATARLKPDGQIGRMAVLASYRDQGIGSRLLAFVIQTAASQHMKQAYLHAQVSAIPFYEKHGFTTNSDVFYEADIPHRKMTLKICME